MFLCDMAWNSVDDFASGKMVSSHLFERVRQFGLGKDFLHGFSAAEVQTLEKPLRRVIENLKNVFSNNE